MSTALLYKQRAEHLWTDASVQVYALVDGARDRRIEPLLQNSGLPFACLYRGSLSPRLQAAAPHIIQLQPDTEITQTLLEEQWGRSWGVFCVTPIDVNLFDIRDHFRRFLRVRDERGRKLIFRYYDPRVLRLYLPTCATWEVRELFGRVSRVLFEDENPKTAIVYDLDEAGLRKSRVPWNTSENSP